MDCVSVFIPDTEEWEGIRDGPSDALSDGFFCIIRSSDELVTSFWVGVSLVVSRKCLLCHRINTATDETIHCEFFVEIEIDDIEVSPYFFHRIILSLITDSPVDEYAFVLIFRDEVLR